MPYPLSCLRCSTQHSTTTATTAIILAADRCTSSKNLRRCTHRLSPSLVLVVAHPRDTVLLLCNRCCHFAPIIACATPGPTPRDTIALHRPRSNQPLPLKSSFDRLPRHSPHRRTCCPRAVEPTLRETAHPGSHIQARLQLLSKQFHLHRRGRQSWITISPESRPLWLASSAHHHDDVRPSQSRRRRSRRQERALACEQSCAHPSQGYTIPTTHWATPIREASRVCGTRWIETIIFRGQGQRYRKNKSGSVFGFRRGCGLPREDNRCTTYALQHISPGSYIRWLAV